MNHKFALFCHQRHQVYLKQDPQKRQSRGLFGHLAICWPMAIVGENDSDNRIAVCFFCLSSPRTQCLNIHTSQLDCLHSMDPHEHISRHTPPAVEDRRVRQRFGSAVPARCGKIWCAGNFRCGSTTLIIISHHRCMRKPTRYKRYLHYGTQVSNINPL